MDTRFQTGPPDAPPRAASSAPRTGPDVPSQSAWLLTLRFVSFVVGIVLVPCGVVFGFEYRAAAASADWPWTQGTITESRARLGGSNGLSTSWVPHVKYTYCVDGQTYTGSKIEYGPPAGDGTLEAEERAAVYPVGRSVAVFYDPVDPSVAVLVPGAHGEYGLSPRWFVFMILFGIAPLFSEAVRWRNGPAWLVLFAVWGIAIALFSADPLLRDYLYHKARHLEAKESARWPTTPGAAPAWIGINWRSILMAPEERGIRYEYVVDGKLYTNTQVEFGVDWARHDGSNIFRRQSFMAGRSGRVLVFYDPANPTRSVLKPGAQAYPLEGFNTNALFVWVGGGLAVVLTGMIVVGQFFKRPVDSRLNK